MTNMQNVNNEKTFVDCEVPAQTNPTNIDLPPGQCGPSNIPSQKQVLSNPVADWKLGGPDCTPPASQSGRRKMGIGQQANCDPIQSGNILNDPDNPDRSHIFRYNRGLKGCNEAMWDLFSNVKVLDEDGHAHIVPCQWASQEKAVGAILQSNVRKDNSGVVDRIPLPMMSIFASGHTMDMKRFTYQRCQSFLPWLDPYEQRFGFTTREKYPRDTVFGVTRGIPLDITYTLYIWTLFQEDMDQILTQVFLRFSPVAYIRVRGVWWEIIVTMDGTTNNIDLEPGDDKLRVLKYQVAMTAKTYLPQPITRHPMPRHLAMAGRMTDQEIKNTIEALGKAAKNIK